MFTENNCLARSTLLTSEGFTLQLSRRTGRRDLLLLTLLVQVGFGGGGIAVGDTGLLGGFSTLLGLGGQFLGCLSFLLCEFYLAFLCGLLCGVGVLLGFESGLACFL
jgi:hypothetical protein